MPGKIRTVLGDVPASGIAGADTLDTWRTVSTCGMPIDMSRITKLATCINP